MKVWQQVTITVHRDAEEAVNDLLQQSGAGGTWSEEYCAETGAPESERIGVTAFFYPALAEAALERLKQAIVQWREYGLQTGPVELNVAWVQEQDWAEGWKEFFQVDTVGQIVIRPTWRSYQPQSGEIVLDLDPGQAFGTGSHPSTRLCLSLLQELTLAGKQVWDIGTGSGILAIAAAKLGAEVVWAVDTDASAVEAARANCSLNQVSARVTLGTIEQIQGPADIIVANITPPVIAALLPTVGARLAAGGLFLASGLVRGREEIVLSEASRQSLTLVKVQELEDWLAFLFRQEVAAS